MPIFFYISFFYFLFFSFLSYLIFNSHRIYSSNTFLDNTKSIGVNRCQNLTLLIFQANEAQVVGGEAISQIADTELCDGEMGADCFCVSLSPRATPNTAVTLGQYVLYWKRWVWILRAVLSFELLDCFELLDKSVIFLWKFQLMSASSPKIIKSFNLCISYACHIG